MNTKAFYKMSYGLYIIATRYDGKDYGCVVNTLIQITSNPAQMSVAINKENYTSKMIDKAGFFTATPLTVDATMDLIGNFGFKTSKDFDKFYGWGFKRDTNGIAYLTQCTNAFFSLKVNNIVDSGTHNIYIGEVLDAMPLEGSDSLTYDYYQRIKKGTTPPKASSYNAKSETASPSATAPTAQTTPQKVKYVCSVCGYEYEGDPLPADFICPVCGQPASVFEKVLYQVFQ